LNIPVNLKIKEGCDRVFFNVKWFRVVEIHFDQKFKNKFILKFHRGKGIKYVPKKEIYEKFLLYIFKIILNNIEN
jgi:hypothetical protein